MPQPDHPLDRSVDHPEPIQILPFSRDFKRAGFDCGDDSVNAWFTSQAGQAERAGAPRTFIAVRGRVVVGFYASVVTVMDRDQAAEAFGVGRATYPKPAILPAQMGVDVSEQRRGLGKVLLVHALSTFIAVSKLTGFEVVLVDALSTEVCAFYRKMGFISLEDHPLRLFMTVASLRASFDAAR